MDTKQMTPAEFLKLLEENDGEAPEGFTLVEEGEWEQEHKDQYKTSVFKSDTSGQFFAVTDSRRGAYWSDWDYGDSHCCEVWPHQVTTTQYLSKKPEVTNG